MNHMSSMHFNLTASFRSDSDIHIPYYRTVRRRNRNSTCEHAQCVPDSSILQNKTKHMVWIVSKCHTSSRREVYFQRLSRYISTDLFGDCGKRIECTRRFFGQSCTQSIVQRYKFYFSAENSICKDYVTGENIPSYIFDPLMTLKYNFVYYVTANKLRLLFSIATLRFQQQILFRKEFIEKSHYLLSKMRVQTK